MPATATSQPPKLGIRFFIDTSVMKDGSPDPDWEQIQRHEVDRWIDLQRSSALRDDLAKDKNPGRRQRLEADSYYTEAFGPRVHGESRKRAHSFDLTAGDQQLLHDLFTVLAPDTKWSADSRTASNTRRDAMHLFTVKKYGASGFITRDERIPKKADVLSRQFDIRVFRPSEAVAFIEGQIRNHHERQRRSRQWERQRRVGGY